MNVFDSVSKVKICVLSHPKKLVTSFIKKLCQKYPDNSTYRNFAALGMSFTTINDFKTNNDPVNIILLQTTNQEFLDKLRLYYQGSAGAIILFKNDDFDSFEAAKRFFQYFRKVTYNPALPVIFVDIEKSIEIIIDEPEQLEDNPNILYYQILEDDVQIFYSIIESIIEKHLVS